MCLREKCLQISVVKNVVFCWSNHCLLIRIHIKQGQTDLGPTTALPFRGGNHLFNVAFGKQRTQFAHGLLVSACCLTNSANLLCPQKRCMISHNIVRGHSKKWLCQNFSKLLLGAFLVVLSSMHTQLPKGSALRAPMPTAPWPMRNANGTAAPLLCEISFIIPLMCISLVVDVNQLLQDKETFLKRPSCVVYPMSCDMLEY